MSRARLRRFFRHGLLPQLLVFESVARLGGVTRAAEALHLAQPTVSMLLKKLAGALEVTLFEQRGRCLHLTPAGHALRAVCDELLELLQRAESRLAPFREHGAQTPAPVPGPDTRDPTAQAIELLRALETAASAALSLRQALQLDAPGAAANNGASSEEGAWKSRATTTRRPT